MITQTTQLMKITIRNILSILFLILFSYPLIAQDKMITGTVTTENQEPLPGVNVLLQGTTNGTQTDFDGNFSIEASQGDVLSFSYIGIKSQNITVGVSNTIIVTMVEDASQLEEVVVTALGVKRQKKSLTYATQQVDTDGIDEARPQQNLVNSLSGKVAGISITRSGNGVSGASKVLLRGNRSISGSSQPLYVVDGVPLGGDISDLSPDDIASMNVLKGANAAALYGARANNGAIIITTKSGTGERVSVDLSTTVTTESANILFDYQNRYGQGSGGVYNPASTGSWGPLFDGSAVPNWSPNPDITGSLPYEAQRNNINDFFQTGFSLANNLSIRSGSKRNQTFFSYTNEQRSGIVPNNELTRHNISLKLDNKLFSDKLAFSGRLNYIRTDINNELYTGENFANPLRHAYRLPRNIRTQDISVFEYIDEAGAVRQNYFDPGNNGGANPYWTINKNNNEIANNRIIGYASLTYTIAENLNLMVRSAVDQSTLERADRYANDSYIFAQNGNYITRNDFNLEWNSDFLLSYGKDINDDFAFDLNFGGNNRKEEFKFVATENRGLNAPNIFTINNSRQLRADEDFFEKTVNSLYGFGQLSAKDAIFLDLTYRSDWSSTLPIDNNRFDYYSAGVSAVITDLVKFPDVISYLKLRGSYAEVGNDTAPYQTIRSGLIIPGGRIRINRTAPNQNLRPERTKSLEFGADARFFDDRFGIDFTYYKSNSINQLFQQTVEIASGDTNRFLNGADIQNKGIEVILTGNPVRTPNFNWNVTVNFTRNESEVLRLAEGLESLRLGGDGFFNSFLLEVGEPWGNLFSRGFERNLNGQVVVGDNGLPIITPGQTVAVGNFNPDWLGGISNTFSYKNLSLGFLIDIRQGGVVGSFTNAILASDGALTSTLQGRDGGLVFGNNVFSEFDAVVQDDTPDDASDDVVNTTAVDAQQLWGGLGDRNAPVGEAFIQDASNIRLRELTLGYSLPNALLDRTPLRTIKISLVGRNLLFFSNKASIDPEIITGATNTPAAFSGNSDNTEAASDGFESFAPPSTRSLGLNVKIGF